MIQTRYIFEVERTLNGFIVREIEESPRVSVDTNAGGFYNGLVTGVNREVQQFVYKNNEIPQLINRFIELYAPFEMEKYPEPEPKKCESTKEVLHS